MEKLKKYCLGDECECQYKNSKSVRCVHCVCIYRLYFSSHFPVMRAFAVWTTSSLRIHLLSLTYFSPLFCPVICVYYLFRGVLFRYLVRSGTIVVSVCLSLSNDSAVCVGCQGCRQLFSTLPFRCAILSVCILCSTLQKVLSTHHSHPISRPRNRMLLRICFSLLVLSLIVSLFYNLFKYCIY